MKQKENFGVLLKKMVSEWIWLFRYIKKYRLITLLYVVIGLLSVAMSLGISVVSKIVIDAVISKENDTLLSFGILVILLAVFQHVFQAVSSWIISVVSSKANNEIRCEIYSHIVSAGWKDVSRYHTGELLNRLESDVASVSGGAISFIPGLIIKLCQFIGALCIVLYHDPVMALLALMSAPFMFLSSKFIVRAMRKYNEKTRELNGKVLSYTQESVQNIQLIKAFDLTKDYINNFTKLLEEFRSFRLGYDKFSILMTLCLSLIGVAVSYSCYGLGIFRLWQGAITFGTMTMFLQLSGVLTSSFSALASMVPSAVSIATAAGRIIEVTSFPEEDDSDKEKALAILRKSEKSGVYINFEKVAFRYDDAENEVLKNISLGIAPGDTIAFIGPSGEGKTTLLKLILGIVKPTEGQLYISSSDGDRVSISDSTRRFCSYVPQDMGIFSGTIADNLRLVKNDATDEELMRVIETADLTAMINALPDGINTDVSESGNNFSQGQLQRIAIARALLRDSQIILMDEATSSLDVETETRVLNNIMVNSPEKICIITTHRESMLKYCNRIYKVNSNGEMTEC